MLPRCGNVDVVPCSRQALTYPAPSWGNIVTMLGVAALTLQRVAQVSSVWHAHSVMSNGSQGPLKL